MPENTVPFNIEKPLVGDVANIETATHPALDRINELFGAINLSQLVVPGSSDGKLLIVKDGAAAYKAMSGDGTIDEDGNFQLGSKVVGTSELGDKAVTGAKVDDETITLGKLVKALGLTEGYFADGAVGPNKLAAAAKNLFPQLVSATQRKLAFGAAVMPTAEASGVAVLSVAHDLGVTPVIVIPVAVSRDVNVGPEGPKDETNFTLCTRDVTGGKSSGTVYWLAIG